MPLRGNFIRRKRMETRNIIISGVGGQGIITASEILSEVALFNGFDVKKSEVHGMSQRGGSVVSHVRFGEKVYSPLIEKGTCDVILAFEKAEALRWVHYLKPGKGIVIVNDLEIIPNMVSLGLDTYPENIEDTLKRVASKVFVMDGIEIAKEAGDPRTANTALLGALSNYLPFSEEGWIEVIKRRVKPNTIEANLKAFKMGRERGRE